MSAPVYLVLRRAWAWHSNTLLTRGLVGGPPVMAACLLGHALERHLRSEGGAADVQITGTAIVVHERHLLSESDGRALQFQQRRGASLVSERKARSLDYPKSASGVALSLQAIAEAHWCVSLVYEVSGARCETDTLMRQVQRMLRGARLAGGRLEVPPGALRVHERAVDAIEAIGNGWLVEDLSEAVLGCEGDPVTHGRDRVADLVDAVLEPRARNDRVAMRAAAVLGYATIEAPVPAQSRQGVREGGDLHAFVEPLIGVVAYRPLREVPTADGLALWHWCVDPETKAGPTEPAGLFYLTQQSIAATAASSADLNLTPGVSQ